MLARERFSKIIQNVIKNKCYREKILNLKDYLAQCLQANIKMTFDQHFRRFELFHKLFQATETSNVSLKYLHDFSFIERVPTMPPRFGLARRRCEEERSEMDDGN